jgi:NIPSNAP
VSRPCWSPIVELRQYSLHPGQRDVLIDLFDRELVETQEAVGMKVIGQFRDLDDPDRFVWVRGFPDMESRAQSLAAFYGGPAWKAHAVAANATMIDSDNVLLLRPARAGSAFTLDGERGSRAGFVLAVVMPLEAAASFDESESGGSTLGSFVTEESENTFPSLPVREGERVFAWFAGFADRGGLDRAAARHADAAEVLRLEPTSRSLLGA